MAFASAFSIACEIIYFLQNFVKYIIIMSLMTDILIQICETKQKKRLKPCKIGFFIVLESGYI